MTALFRAFFYGSNMYPPRLRARTPSARFLYPAELRGHRLKFHKGGMDGSAKADAFHTGAEADVVRGVVAEIQADEKSILDRFEGLGRGYDLNRVDVLAGGGDLVSVWVYQASPDALRSDLQPFDWYVELCLAGARAHGLPADYITEIERVPRVADADLARARRNRMLLLD
jgi:hypothetical protein